MKHKVTDMIRYRAAKEGDYYCMLLNKKISVEHRLGITLTNRFLSNYSKNFLIENECFHSLVYNINEFKNYSSPKTYDEIIDILSKNSYSMNSLISGLFYWSSSKEGNEFWQNKHNKFICFIGETSKLTINSL